MPELVASPLLSFFFSFPLLRDNRRHYSRMKQGARQLSDAESKCAPLGESRPWPARQGYQMPAEPGVRRAACIRQEGSESLAPDLLSDEWPPGSMGHRLARMQRLNLGYNVQAC